MLESLLVAALLTVTDPAGDTFGAGSLSPPTAAVYRNLAPLDLQSITLDDAPEFRMAIEMGSLSNPFDLPLGFSLPVIEVYVEGEEGTGAELLPGSEMGLPEGVAWEIAVRLTGEQAVAYRSTEAGVQTVDAEVSIEGSTLLVSAPFPRPGRPRLFAAVGLYDLFGSSPWRSLSELESPWAFSSAGRGAPVIDVLAADGAAQSQAIETGVLPPAGSRASDVTVWLLLMGGGLALALTGVVLRLFVRRPEPPAPSEDADEQPMEADSLTEAPEAGATAAEEEPAELATSEEEPGGELAADKVGSDAQPAAAEEGPGRGVTAAASGSAAALVGEDQAGDEDTTAAGAEGRKHLASDGEESDALAANGEEANEVATDAGESDAVADNGVGPHEVAANGEEPGKVATRVEESKLSEANDESREVPAHGENRDEAAAAGDDASEAAAVGKDPSEAAAVGKDPDGPAAVGKDPDEPADSVEPNQVAANGDEAVADEDTPPLDPALKRKLTWRIVLPEEEDGEDDLSGEFEVPPRRRGKQGPGG